MDRTSSEVDATKYGTEGAFFLIFLLYFKIHISQILAHTQVILLADPPLFCHSLFALMNYF
jgi:hypothetical protein